MLIILSAQAQDKIKRIGNKPRTGSSNSSYAVVKGQQIGIKMNAGKKPVQLLSLNFTVENRRTDTIDFKVNVYEFAKEIAGENYVKQDIIGHIAPGKSVATVNLEPYNIQVKGDVLAAIEWVKTLRGANPYFSIGILNGGTYTYANDEWKKMGYFGADFNMMVKVLKK
ncbi:hypothetical protein FPZ43_06555 [Mucilaginibacter pallidiroseus]|uniref:Uncharacterized protein n=2 Tax=Mucilaginibacter pallidiroseus TaxID=2599295 RepID=A0A563UGV4_9SPHI|nr:hypothetical protein FPZ43_06555 [Mucilaginibacter pallidiroseus]